MSSASIVIEEGYSPGCVGRIVELHGRYYAEHQGFGSYFERKVARELGEFCSRYEAGCDGLWVARRDGVVEGAIAIDGRDADCARLRWFIVSDALRGTGVGTRLIQAAIEFCRAGRFPEVRLATFSTLKAARHLYEKLGFKCISAEPGTHWGKEVMEECYVLDLRDPGAW